MVEQKPSKLTTRVRFPSPAPYLHEVIAGCFDESDVVEKVIQAGHACPCSSVAEHSLGKGEVASSILAMGSTGFN